MTFKQYQKRLASRIHDLRVEAGLSQEQAAQQAGITRQHYQRLEGGTTNPTLETLVNIAKVLRQSLADLVTSVEK